MSHLGSRLTWDPTLRVKLSPNVCLTIGTPFQVIRQILRPSQVGILNNDRAILDTQRWCFGVLYLEAKTVHPLNVADYQGHPISWVMCVLLMTTLAGSFWIVLFSFVRCICTRVTRLRRFCWHFAYTHSLTHTHSHTHTHTHTTHTQVLSWLRQENAKVSRKEFQTWLITSTSYK